MVRESGDLTQHQDVSLAPKWDDPILEKHFQAHTSTVLSLSYNHDGSQLASGSKDGVLKIWNFKPQMNSYVFKESETPINCVCFSPCGKLLASTSRSYVRLRTPERTSEYWTLRAHVLSVRHVHFSYDSEHLATCGDDKTIKVWGIKHFNHKFAYSLIGHNNWVRCIKFSPDANTLVSCSDDSTVKIWDLNSKQCVLSLDGHHAGSVRSVDYHPSGHYVASTGTDKTVRIFDLRTQRMMQLHKISMGSANSVHYHRTGQYLACAVSDGTLKIYDVAQAKMLYTLHGHVNSVNCVQFAKDGNYLCSGDSSGKILLWRTNFRQTSADSIVSPKIVLRSTMPNSFKNDESQEKCKHKKHSISMPRPTRRAKSADNTPSSNRRPIKTSASSCTPHMGSSGLSQKSKPSSSSASYSSSNRDLIVKRIENAVHDIVGQISLLADSISLLERRLSRTEQDVKDIKDTINVKLLNRA